MSGDYQIQIESEENEALDFKYREEQASLTLLEALKQLQETLNSCNTICWRIIQKFHDPEALSPAEYQEHIANLGTTHYE